jgi:hypothetical protein
MKKLLMYLLPALAFLSGVSCRHKDLYDEFVEPKVREMRIVIHWPDGEVVRPTTGMMVNLFGMDRTPHYGMNFFPIEGGPVKLVEKGSYRGHCYDYYVRNIYFRNEYDYHKIEAFCSPLSRATYSRQFPDEVTVSEPDNPFWVDNVDEFLATGDDMHFYTQNIVEQFTFEVRGIIGVENISATRGGISGMAGAVLLHDKSISKPSTVLFNAKKDVENKTITGSFNTFGDLRTMSNVNNFTIEILHSSSTGGIKSNTWDVTDQVLAATHTPGIPDIIVQYDVVIPRPDDPGSGFKADVEEWETVVVPMKM